MDHGTLFEPLHRRVLEIILETQIFETSMV